MKQQNQHSYRLSGTLGIQLNSYQGIFCISGASVLFWVTVSQSSVYTFCHYFLLFILIQAVENPTHQEIRDVLSAAGMKVGVENKLYSREKSKELLYRGRIRVQLKSDDGKPLNPDLPSRKLNFMTGNTFQHKFTACSSKICRITHFTER